jgi:hypothetical protein
VSPDTPARLASAVHRPEVRRSSPARARTPPTSADTRQLVVRMATENRDWG